MKLLKKLFKKQKSKANLEIINYTDIDLEVTIDKIDNENIKIILSNKKDLEIVEQRKIC